MAVILVSAMTFARPLPAFAQGYHRVDKISSSVKSDPRLRSLTGAVDYFYRFLQDKDFGGLYDFLPVAYTAGVSRDEFVNGGGAHDISRFAFPGLGEITAYEIKNVTFVDDARASVQIVLSVFDVLDGVKDRIQDSLWVKEYGVWTCPELYRRMLDRSKQPDAFEQEMKKEIMKDEVYDFIRSD
jgi:hypothetical protein